MQFGNINPLEWYKKHEEANLLISFTGDFNQDLVKAILIMTQNKPDVIKAGSLIKNRLFAAIVECLQNICKHGIPKSTGEDLKPGVVLIAKERNGYSVSAGNWVTKQQKKELEDRFSKISGLDENGLKLHQKEMLMESKQNDNGNANIGLISLARKSSTPMECSFKEIEENNFFYSIKISV